MKSNKTVWIVLITIIIMIGSVLVIGLSSKGNRLYQNPIPILGEAYYVSVDEGCDSNTGTKDNPFQTIQRAIEVLLPGDVCYIRGGVYRETLSFNRDGEEGKPILIMPYNGEKVVVSGADKLDTKWERYNNHIYRTPINWDLGIGSNQVFADGEVLIEARHPNADVRSTSSATYSTLFPTRGYYHVDSVYKDKVTSPHLDQSEEDYWKGGLYVGGHNAVWAWQSAHIRSSKEGEITLKNKTSTWWFPISNYYSAEMHEGYITSHVNAIDQPSEWVIDDGFLYIFSDDKHLLEKSYEVKKRQVVIDLTDSQYIYLYGLQTFAGSVTMANAKNCILDRMKMSYTSHFQYFKDARNGYIKGRERGEPILPPSKGHVGIYVSGEGNVIKNSTIQYSAGAGVYLAGYGNELHNNLIHDVGYANTYLGGIYLTEYDKETDQPLGAHRITHNTIYNIGRSAIHIGALGDLIPEFKNNEIAYNEIFNTMLFTSDGGAFYAYSVNLGKGTERSSFHHNYVWDSFRKSGEGIIYSDNFVEGIDFYQNVAWGHEYADHQMYQIKTDSRHKDNLPKNLGGNFNLGTLEAVADDLKGYKIEGFEYFEAGCRHEEDPFKVGRPELPRPEPYNEPKGELYRSTWIVSASSSFDEYTAPENAIDRDDRFSYWRIEGESQGPSDYFMVDLGKKETFSRIILKTSGVNSPRSYQVLISDDGDSWSQPVGMGDSAIDILDIRLFDTYNSRYIKIVQNEKSEESWQQFWSISDIKVYEE